MKEKSESELVGLIKVGDRSSFKELYDQYWEMLFRFTYSVLENEEISQDIVQEIFIDLWERRKKLHIENVKAFLFQAARNQTAKHIRHIVLHKKHQDAISKLSGVDLSTDSIFELKELDQSIKKHLQDLPNRCGEIFQMSRYEHYGNKEIAEKLNISIRTVETQISKAIKHLRKSLGPEMLLSFFLIYEYCYTLQF